jgi:hypothetical protein
MTASVALAAPDKTCQPRHLPRHAGQGTCQDVPVPPVQWDRNYSTVKPFVHANYATPTLLRNPHYATPPPVRIAPLAPPVQKPLPVRNFTPPPDQVTYDVPQVDLDESESGKKSENIKLIFNSSTLGH